MELEELCLKWQRELNGATENRCYNVVGSLFDFGPLEAGDLPRITKPIHGGNEICAEEPFHLSYLFHLIREASVVLRTKKNYFISTRDWNVPLNYPCYVTLGVQGGKMYCGTLLAFFKSSFISYWGNLMTYCRREENDIY